MSVTNLFDEINDPYVVHGDEVTAIVLSF